MIYKGLSHGLEVFIFRLLCLFNPPHELLSRKIAIRSLVNGPKFQMKAVGLFNIRVSLKECCGAHNLAFCPLVREFIQDVPGTSEQLPWRIPVAKDLNLIAFTSLSGF